MFVLLVQCGGVGACSHSVKRVTGIFNIALQ